MGSRWSRVPQSSAEVPEPPDTELLEPSTQISTGIQCDNCHVGIARIKWKRCSKCNVFDLCHACVEDNYKNFRKEAGDLHKEWHKRFCSNEPANLEYMDDVRIDTINENEANFLEMKERLCNKIWTTKTIDSDYQMAHFMDALKDSKESQSQSEERTQSQLLELIGKYYKDALKTKIKILSLDGGGIRGYMTIEILIRLITEENRNGFKKIREINHQGNTEHEAITDKEKDEFLTAQNNFTDKFNYVSGTSAGGLIAFCLAVKHNLIEVMSIFKEYDTYFKAYCNPCCCIGPVCRDKYNPTRIYQEINTIIDQTVGEIKLNGQPLTHENATLRDIHSLLNPDYQYRNEGASVSAHSIKPIKALIITAYNTTKDTVRIFNTSYEEHWGYRIADVLKATMAAPTYFKPVEMHKGISKDDRFVQVEEPTKRDNEIYIDGGVFANDPELAALWAIRMQWKQPVSYRFLSIGTGTYDAQVSVEKWRGGYCYWLVNKGLLISMLMDSTRSFTERIMTNLAEFNNIKRMKLNYKLKKPMDLDDKNFVREFNADWEKLDNGDDYQVLCYFYDRYIKEQQQQ